MIAGRKIIVVLPAYNAERTLEKTYRAIPRDAVDGIILTDDGSRDGTVAAAKRLDMTVLAHDRNRGYGANQKTCYRQALAAGADVVVMLHPDYQYDPALIPKMVGMAAREGYDLVLGSRMLDGSAMKGGMPLYKYLGNRFLTAWQNYFMKQNLSEYHSGYRAFSRRLLEAVPMESYSDDFIFDNEILVAALEGGFRVGEIACPARYEHDSSSIHFWHSLKYGLQVVFVSLAHRRRWRS
jgi:glycosyltransferase involved in cell wall biosynthesis